MDAHPRIHEPAAETPTVADAPRRRAFTPEAQVVLLRPRRLRGTVGVLKRRLTAGWEVEVRSASGVPLHLTLPERALHLR